MSDCGCTTNKELYKKLLKVFQKDDKRYNGDAEPLSDIYQFTVFNESDMEKAHRKAKELSEMGVSEMIDLLSDLKNRHPKSNYVDYISRIALFKHAETKNMTLPPPHQTIPHAFFPKEESLLDPETTIVGSAATLDPEYKLNWWREDLGLSEHHYHWHVYYAYYTAVVMNRQGELFVYMHEQMLARYNFERLGAGLSPVVPFGPGFYWCDPLLEGFNPKLEDHSFRPASMKIPCSVTLGNREISTFSMETHHRRINNAIAEKHLKDSEGKTFPMTMNNLGCTMEANMGSVNKNLYGNLHNNGHVVIGLINDPDGRYEIKYGAMMSEITAARDPVFFRWHKFVDNIFEAYRESAQLNNAPHTINDLQMEGIEVDDVYTLCEPDKELESQQQDNIIFTRMKEIEYTVKIEKKDNVLCKTVLQYYPFTYNFKVRNKCDDKASLVFRVFLAPIRHAENLDARRRDFVEMDRFVVEIDGWSERIITRSSEVSTVILPPTVTLQDLIDEKFYDSSYSPCGCGWPRNLLVPRGTSEGMRADLYVLVTDWAKDAVDEKTCLSASVAYCGKNNIFDYPDKKPMGFPFDRKFSSKLFPDLETMVKEVPNSAKQEIKIRFLEKSD